MSQDTLIYGLDKTAAQIALEGQGIEARDIPLDPDVWYLVRVHLDDLRVIERYPTKELASIGAAYWRHIGCTAQIYRKEVTQ